MAQVQLTSERTKTREREFILKLGKEALSWPQETCRNRQQRVDWLD